MDTSAVRGLPLLSGPPPRREDPNQKECRRCGKDFGFNLPIIGRNSKECNFCGFSYCSACCDHQALMPRTGDETGYDPVDVCSFCFEYLMMTAASRSQLRAYPISKLRAYLKAFSIQAPGALEKDDYIQAIIDAKHANGCLPAANEQYYRRSSVPDQRTGRPQKRGFLDRAADAAHAARQAFDNAGATAGAAGSSRPPPPPPRPASQPPPQNRPHPRSHAATGLGFRPSPTPQRPPQPQQYRASPSPSPRPPQQQQYRPPPGPPLRPPQQQQQQSRPPPPPPENRSPTVPPPQPTPARRPEEPIPPLSSLLDTSNEDLSKLSAHVLKEILHQNHVNARLLLEKSDLVERVRVLIEAERAERQREEEMRRLEEEEAIERQRGMMEDLRRREEQRAAAQSSAPQTAPERVESPSVVPHDDSASAQGELLGHHQATAPQPPSAPPLSSLPRPPMERSGLCVVCQDAEANMALVDCGHLALCKACSDLIWSTNRECPLCRTRIVTQERMLRIFRT